MSQILLEKTETMLYNACEEAPFYIQIDKYNKEIGLLSFVDKETNLIIPVPEEDVMVCTIAAPSFNKETKKWETPQETRTLLEKLPNKPCFKIVTQKHYAVMWKNRQIMELKPIHGWVCF
jgi:peroxiredoxin